MKGVLVVALALLASSTAMAQWTLTWYVSPEQSGGTPDLTNTIIDNTGAAQLDVGDQVYLVYAGADGIVQGIDALTGNILGDDVVVSLYGGGYGEASIGDVDQLPFDPQGPGEFYQASSMLDSLDSGTFYAVAFETPVTYVSGDNRFQTLGQNYFGVSGTYTATGAPSEVWDVGPFQTSTSLIPEPATIALMAAGMGGVMAYRRKGRLVAA